LHFSLAPSIAVWLDQNSVLSSSLNTKFSLIIHRNLQLVYWNFLSMGNTTEFIGLSIPWLAKYLLQRWIQVGSQWHENLSLPYVIPIFCKI